MKSMKQWKMTGYARNSVFNYWEDVQLLSKASPIELLVETKDGRRYTVPITQYKSKARMVLQGAA